MFNIFLRQYVGSRSFETGVLKWRWLNESSIYLYNRAIAWGHTAMVSGVLCIVLKS